MTNYWFVGASYGGNDDQTERFLQEGIWQSGNDGKYIDVVKTIKPGDKIAIKSAYTQKNGLPFKTNGHTASVMAIKAIGTVIENKKDGYEIVVDWKPFTNHRYWYFYTNRTRLWKLKLTDWMARELIDFAFHNDEQDIDKFRNANYWRERFGDDANEVNKYPWISFYSELADALRGYRHRRDELMSALHAIAEKHSSYTAIFNDQYEEGIVGGPLQDICPFTVMGMFNRGISDTNRVRIAQELADFLKVKASPPQSFNAVPLLNNQNSWFFRYAYARESNDIEKLWDVFEAALDYADKGAEDESHQATFVAAYDKASRLARVGWKLTMGFFWIRAWDFVPLDRRSRDFIEHHLGVPIPKTGTNQRCTGEEYNAITNHLKEFFVDINNKHKVYSFPDLSSAAYQQGSNIEEDYDDFGYESESPAAAYTVNNIMSDGCFLSVADIEHALQRLKDKKNLILQGPPGTGKTWLAKRLAYALVGEKDDRKVLTVQFHPNLSYEDFIRGWRPSGEGRLQLMDGPFIELAETARKDLNNYYVMVIEEINRGNPAQVFGEMLTLLEADKRNHNSAMRLTYTEGTGEHFYLPPNLYVIGTMNIADRSLALIDLALRRRFAFIDLQPSINERWVDWLESQYSFSQDLLMDIKSRMVKLNATITSDVQLGGQFMVGHSYVTPTSHVVDLKAWFKQVVNTEIKPLLEEYWFNDVKKAESATKELLEGW